MCTKAFLSIFQLWLLLNLRKLILRVSNGEAMVVDHPMVVDIDLQGHPMAVIDLQGHPMGHPMEDMVEKRETPNLKVNTITQLAIFHSH